MLHRAGSEPKERERAQQAFEQTLEVARTRAQAEGGRWAFVISLLALILSAISLFETVLKQARPVVHAGTVMHYARDAEGVEVFAMPVTITNHGAREAVVAGLDLSVLPARTGVAAAFTSAYVGTGGNPAKDKQPFTPLSIPGRSSYTGTILFYPADLKSRAPFIVTSGEETYRFCITPRMDAIQEHWLVAPFDWLNGLLGETPFAPSFEAELPWFAARALDASQPIPLQIKNAKRRAMPRGRPAPGCD